MIVKDRTGRERQESPGYILQDGESMIVSTVLMDHLPSPDAQRQRAEDARWNAYLNFKHEVSERWSSAKTIDAAPARKPVTSDAREAAYLARNARLQNAWRAA